MAFCLLLTVLLVLFLQACHSVITLPSVLYESFNVAMAGSIIMYDRVAKEKKPEHPISSSQLNRETTISSSSYFASETVVNTEHSEVVF
jgi:tRNA C32,U32 (ribose-2'-O)-methylase TrmJ